MLQINNISDSNIYFNLSGDVTDEEIELLFKKLTELTNGGGRFKFIADSTNLKNISITKSSCELYWWMYNQREQIENTLMCSSLIITNNILVNLINGVFHIIPPIRPTKICNNLQEGLQFLNS